MAVPAESPSTGAGEADQDPKWKRFERLVAQIQKGFLPDAEVVLDDRMRGRKSGSSRQVDVSVRSRVGQFDILIAIECKDLSGPADVKDVEDFLGLIDDIGAQKGAMVSSGGFTQGALRRGEEAGIDLCRLVDAESRDWRSYPAIPALYDYRKIEKFSFEISGSSPFALQVPRDIRLLPVFSADGQPLGPIGEVISRHWNCDEFPTDPGTHEGLPLPDGPHLVMSAGGLVPVRFLVNLKVNRTLMFGYVPILRTQGFRDELTGHYTTRELTTDVVDIEEIEEKWTAYEDEEALPVRPVFTFHVRNAFDPQVSDRRG